MDGVFLGTPTPIEVWTGRRRLAEGASWPPSTSGVADRGDTTMNEHPDVEVVRQMTEALTSGDFETAGTYLADDIVWHEIGRAEPRRGKAELQANMGEVDYEITGTLHAIIGDDEHVVALIDATGTRAGKTLDYHVAEIYHVKDGRITERWAFSDDTAAITEFFA
jgi:ketosteroid isomerase-like protein